MKRVQILFDAYNEKEILDILSHFSLHENIHIELLEDDITDILVELGIPSGLKGYPYLITAVELCLDDRDRLNHITKSLYPEIARRHCVNGVKVEHAIRNAIQKAWLGNESSLRKNIFGNTTGVGIKPTNAAFIAAIADYVELRRI